MIPLSSSAEQKLRLILAKLLDEHRLGAVSATSISLRTEQFLADTDIDRFQFLKILANFQERKLITSFMIRKGGKVRHPSDDRQDFDTCGIGLGVNFKEKADEYLAELSLRNNPDMGLTLHLDKTGILWHSVKDRYFYPMAATKDRLAIMRYLIQSTGYQSTNSIASALGGKKSQDVRTSIAKMRERIKHLLKIDDLIEGKKDYGYQINTKYKIFVD